MIKSKITSRFNKSKFELLNCGTALDGDWNGVDEYIRDFIKELNKSEHISTLFSCEGHHEKDNAYIFFNVDEIGWDIFWLKILPELACRFSYIDPTISEDMVYMLSWRMSVADGDDDKITTGISIHCDLNPLININWLVKKERFWNTLKETFLKYYV